MTTNKHPKAAELNEIRAKLTQLHEQRRKCDTRSGHYRLTLEIEELKRERARLRKEVKAVKK